MKLTGLGALGVGYVLGSRAGKERYEQIRQLAGRAARRLKKYGEDGTLASWIEGRRTVRTLEPDGASHLSDGAVVEARLDARLFGVKVLREDGTVLLAPGHLVAPPRVVQQHGPGRAPYRRRGLPGARRRPRARGPAARGQPCPAGWQGPRRLGPAS